MDELQSRLGYTFKDARFLTLALTHASVAHEKGVPSENNQRLEFLGDAVLQLVLTTELYNRYTELDEGALTKARAKMVSGSALGAKGRELGVGEHLILSKGEQSNGGRDRASTLADTFEAVLGAIYLDGGIEAATVFVLRHFAESLEEIGAITSQDNPKGQLQEKLQAVSDETPTYKLISSSGPDHDRVFECMVIHGGKELGRGTGKSKRLAESAAAIAALEQLKQVEELPEPPTV